MVQLLNIIGDDYVVWDKSAAIFFKRPARENLYAEFVYTTEEIADIKNVGGKSAGTITAGAYLQEFVGDIPWVHLDIAGTAWNFTEKTYIPAKAPSGVGVRLLLTLIRNWQPI